MYRLIAYARNGVQRFPLGRGRVVIGRDESCVFESFLVLLI